MDTFDSVIPASNPDPIPDLRPDPPNACNADPFREIFLADLSHNLTVAPSHREYHEETWAAAFVMRTFSPQSYEFQRHLLPLPQIKHIDEHYADELALISSAITDPASLPQRLEQYLELHVPKGCTGLILPSFEDDLVVYHNTQGDSGFIPAVLGVDAMAVEPYSEQTKRLLLLKQAERHRTGESPDAPQPTVETANYLFVYYLMPLDPELPNLVLSVVPHVDGKATPDSNNHIKALRDVCHDHGFSIAAFTADGDSAYQEFLKPLVSFALSEEGMKLTFEQLVGLMPRCIEYPFITDFLHFLKCLRNRLARYLLSLHTDLPPISGDEIGRLLSIEQWLKPKSPSDQLKDAVALKVFTFDNLLTLLAAGSLFMVVIERWSRLRWIQCNA
jgi:hypothetical protein